MTATLDRSDDPVDVHRFEVPAGRRVRVSVTPSVGDPDLYVMSRRARSVRDDRRVLGRSRKGSTRTDAVMVRNRNAKRTAMYAVVAFSTAKPPRGAEAAYTLALERR